MEIGKGIIEAVKETLKPTPKSLNEAAGEILVNGKPVQTEEFGTPVTEGDTIKIPVVVAVIYDEYGLEGANKPPQPDQAWLDKNRDAILQRLVVKMNDSFYGSYGSRSQVVTYFDTGNFKMEWLEGGIIRLKTTIVLDLRDALRGIRDLRWRLNGSVYDLLNGGQSPVLSKRG